jgi:hypothetical protein
MHRFFWVILACLSSAPSLLACEGCKEPSSVAGSGGVTGIGAGFSGSVLFMLAMIAGILGGMIWMIVQSCRQLQGNQAVVSRSTTR